MFLNEMTRVKLFTHNDLDGRGCEIVGRLAFPNIDVTIVRNPQDASKKVAEFVKNGEHRNYDRVFITDISVDEETAEIIQNAFIADEDNNFYLLDHHGTALFLNKYSWAEVEVEGNRYGVIGKNAGTSMFFDLLDDYGLFKDKMFRHALGTFVEKVRRYDTWEWKNIYDDKEAGALNQLFYLIGSDVFVERYVKKFMYDDLFYVMDNKWRGMFSDTDKAVLEVDNSKKDSYIDRKEKQMTRHKLLGYNVGVVFAEQYISELGNALSERNQDLDFIVMLDMGGKKVSYRTIHSHVDLGKQVAKVFCGGGHSKASGSQFSSTINNLVYKAIFGIGLIGKFRKLIDKKVKN